MLSILQRKSRSPIDIYIIRHHESGALQAPQSGTTTACRAKKADLMKLAIKL